MEGVPADAQAGPDQDHDQGGGLEFVEQLQHSGLDQVETVWAHEHARRDHPQDAGQTQPLEDEIAEESQQDDERDIGQHSP